MIIDFSVLGKFQAKQRPRFNTKSGFAYTPKETRIYENLVRCKGEEKMLELKLTPFNGPLFVNLNFYFEVPKSATKKMIEAITLGKEKPTKKPDVDNIAKTILDSLNGICYHDDSQVVDLRVIKSYNLNQTGVYIEIGEIND